MVRFWSSSDSNYVTMMCILLNIVMSVLVKQNVPKKYLPFGVKKPVRMVIFGDGVLKKQA